MTKLYYNSSYQLEMVLSRQHVTPSCPFRFNSTLNRNVATAPTVFRFLHDVQAKIWPQSRAHITQADAGLVPKIFNGRLKMLQAAEELEERYKKGEISAEELLKEAATQATNLEFRNMLVAAAAEDALDNTAATNRPDPVLQITQELVSDDEEDDADDPHTDSEQEEEEADIRERRHEWRSVDWPETIGADDQAEDRLPSNRVLPEEDVDRIVVSVCTVCAVHFDFHLLLAHCPHHVCRNCFAKLTECPICRKPRGTLAMAKTIANNPSLVRADAEGRQENEVLTSGGFALL